jgi:prepilin-type N-terminal cleavage/methylation domain-containing protein/prepilin-type processing-associated H-X9-DG protein
MKRVQAFTLIELLVVVAIIALLVAILLPTLGRSREQARMARCGVNMRGIALGITVYAQENQGVHLPEFVKSGSPLFANGFFWSTELVAQGYVKSRSNLDDAGVNMIMDRSSNSAFYCPDCPLDTKPNGGLAQQSFPRDMGNRWPNHQKTPNATVPGSSRVYTWYGLNCSVTANNDMGAKPAGTAVSGATPFIDFSGNTGTPPASADGRYQRTTRLILSPSRMAMVLEAPVDDLYVTPTAQSKAPLLRGVHGDSVNNDQDGTTNIAFFDGHVSKYPTLPYSTNGYSPIMGSVNPMPVTVQDTIFFLQQQ